MKQVNKENHFIWLTAALVAMLIAGALTAEFPESYAFSILEFSSIVLLLLALKSLREDRNWRTRLLILIGLMLMAAIARSVAGFQHFQFLYMILLLAFFVSVAWVVGKGVLLTGHVNINIIIGSVALYLVLAMIWAIFYTMVLEFSPESFNGFEPVHWVGTLNTMTYFSFVTLTTLGYGDISPARPVAEVLVVLEAVTGMFYLAIVVASLISSTRKK